MGNEASRKSIEASHSRVPELIDVTHNILDFARLETARVLLLDVYLYIYMHVCVLHTYTPFLPCGPFPDVCVRRSRASKHTYNLRVI